MPNFQLGTEADDADDRIIYDQTTGNLYFDADGNGEGEQILVANLGKGTVLEYTGIFSGGGQASEPAKVSEPVIEPIQDLAVWDIFMV
ncbi:hypothetical protein ED21_21049 [Erythrobacter sp. SD-21]|nr:hypothetical protein ED21_21049 [Erythrobacter sp. SD-21]